MLKPTSLEGAKQWLRARFDDGADCPCCGQFVKRYRRKLNSNMVRFLVSLGKAQRSSGEPWVDYRDCAFRGRDYNQIAHWGLAETAPLSSDSEKRTSGMWRATELGFAFLEGRERVPSHCYIYNGSALGFSEELISIHEATGSHFDFSELMRETPPRNDLPESASAMARDLASRIGK